MGELLFAAVVGIAAFFLGGLDARDTISTDCMNAHEIVMSNKVVQCKTTHVIVDGKRVSLE